MVYGRKDPGRAVVYTIIVAYNGGGLLGKAVISVLADMSLRDRVVVVDNASSDDCMAELPSDNRIVPIKLRDNVGFGRACNVGLGHALQHGADYCFLLNQDATVEVGCVPTLIEIATERPDCGLVAPIQLRSSGDGLDQRFIEYILRGAPEILHDLWFGRLERSYETAVAPNAAAWLLSRECLMRVGGFDPVFFMYGEDVDLFMRLRKRGFKARLVPTSHVIHHRAILKEVDGPKVSISSSRHVLRKTGKTLATLKGEVSLRRGVTQVIVDTSGDVARLILSHQFRYAAGSIVVLGRSLGKLPEISRNRRIASETGPHWLSPRPSAKGRAGL